MKNSEKIIMEVYVSLEKHVFMTQDIKYKTSMVELLTQHATMLLSDLILKWLHLSVTIRWPFFQIRSHFARG